MNRVNKFFLLTVIVFIFFYLSGGKKVFRSLSETKKDYHYLTLFSEVAAKASAYYLEDINPAAEFPAAFAAMLGSLDRTSAYLDPQKTKIYHLYEKGDHYSTGIFGAKSANYFYITDVLKDSPAANAGLGPGDVIRAAQGQSFFSQSYWQMYFSLLSDKVGSVELLVLKKGAKEPILIKLQTEPIRNTAQVQDLGKGILLVKLPRTDGPTLRYLRQELGGEKPLKLIIDLRRYAGGDFESFLGIARLFFHENTSQSLTVERKSEKTDVVIGSKEPLNYKAAVIVNRSTLMYGELLAALFKASEPNDSPAATLIGSKTPGFISQLKQIPFQDGSSILVPEGLFLRQGKAVAKWGVKPHIELDASEFDKVIAICTRVLEKD